MIHPKLDRITLLFVSFLVLSTAAIILAASDGFDKLDPRFRGDDGPAVNFGNSYRRNIQRIFNFYLLERSKLDVSAESAREPWLIALAKVREELLLLKTTSEWQNKHLLLILDIDKMRGDLSAGNRDKALEDEAELIARFNKI
ncbi:MAG: hypothetical protein AAB849_01445 [Patescibacteria group bacterium]